MFELRHEAEIHAGPVKSMDAEGGRIVTGGADGTVRLLDADGRVIAVSEHHSDLVNAVRFGPNGNVASASKDHTVRVWNPATDSSRVIGRHDAWAMGVAWGDNGESVASGSEDSTVRVWSVGGEELERVDLGYPANGVDRRGGTIAVADGDHKLYLVEGGAVARSVTGAGQLLWTVRFSPDGSRVAWAGRDRRIRVFDRAGGDVLEIPAHRAQIWSVVWSPDGRRLVSASADRTAAIWSAEGEPLERIETPAWVRAAAFLDDGIALAGEDGRIRFYRENGGRAQRPTPVSIPKPPRSCAHWEPAVTETTRTECQECDSTESLRLCVTCGHVGCCESQRAHATKHWEGTGHPNTTPTPAGPFAWRWCYADDMYVKRVAAPVG